MDGQLLARNSLTQAFPSRYFPFRFVAVFLLNDQGDVMLNILLSGLLRCCQRQ